MNRRRAGGFTLIEVVISLAILGLSLGALYGAFENALVRTRHDAHLTEGNLIAQSLLSRAGLELQLSPGELRGEWNGYTYEVMLTAVSPPGSQPPYTVPTAKVSAKVMWTDGDQSRDVTLSTLKLLPKVDQ
jgi:general secretion pathway protein I